MQIQKNLCMALRPSYTDCKSAFPHTQSAFNRFEVPFETGCTPTATLLAQLLKRQARHVMRDVSLCPPDTLPAHVQRIADLQEVISLAIRGALLSPVECRLSGGALSCPATVADFADCLAITKQQHRAPVLLEGPDSERLTRIEAKLETIATYLAEVANA